MQGLRLIWYNTRRMTTIDILYVLGEGSTHDDVEFRWSLRSLEAHAKDIYGEVNVVPKVAGRAPDWFAGEALPVADLTRRAQYNMAHKIAAACRAGLVEGEFMMSADDHFLTRDVDFARAPQYWKNPMLKPYDGKGNNFHKGIGLARDVLLVAGLPAMDFSQHFNVYMHAADADRATELMERASLLPNGEVGANAASVFGNLWVVRNAASERPRPLLWRRDVKYPADLRDTLTKGDAERHLGFSISDAAFDEPGFVDWMNERYKEKSRWEK